MTIGAMTPRSPTKSTSRWRRIVTNSNAGLRWLSDASPDLEEARSALKQIAKDGHRCERSDRKAFGRCFEETQHKSLHDVNDIVQEALTLVQGELKKQKVSVRTELGNELRRCWPIACKCNRSYSI